MNLSELNTRINRDYNSEITASLQDSNLINEYKSCISVQNKIKQLETILLKYVNQEISDKIIADYSTNLIPPGTKGVIKGLKFNRIIKDIILGIKLDNQFEVKFETKYRDYTEEIPDWYIRHTPTNRVLIGMNQLDLWSGGHQTNRFSNYMQYNKPNSKLLCVVCNHINFKTTKSKIYRLVSTGFNNSTLCYPDKLKSTILEFFANV
jgi:hypothetical protein